MPLAPSLNIFQRIVAVDQEQRVKPCQFPKPMLELRKRDCPRHTVAQGRDHIRNQNGEIDCSGADQPGIVQISE